MIYKKILFIFLLALAAFSAGSVLASEKNIDVYLFSAEGCPHCANEKEFLDKMAEKYDNLVIHEMEVTKNEKNRDLFEKTLNKLGVKSNGVPFTVIGEEYFIGFSSEETTGIKIENAIKKEIDNFEGDEVSKPAVDKIKLPIFGEISIRSVSLPVLTILIGTIDGFNPCSMWVLIFLISLLLGMEDRRRMWILGITFIVSSSAVYFLFMTAWLNLLLFLGFIFWVRIVIGLVALISGIYYLKDFYTNKEGACKVDGGGKKKKVFDKLREIVHDKTFWLAFVGIILLAFAVNLVELICSAGFPAVYTQVLTLSDIPTWQYYSYILFYIFFFMLDDIIVFFFAMFTLKTVAISGKYSRLSRLIGGILMLILGILLVLKPEWLMFG